MGGGGLILRGESFSFTWTLVGLLLLPFVNVVPCITGKKVHFKLWKMDKRQTFPCSSSPSIFVLSIKINAWMLETVVSTGISSKHLHKWNKLRRGHGRGICVIVTTYIPVRTTTSYVFERRIALPFTAWPSRGEKGEETGKEEEEKRALSFHRQAGRTVLASRSKVKIKQM